MSLYNRSPMAPWDQKISTRSTSESLIKGAGLSAPGVFVAPVPAARER
jgi:hypothetical protein